MSYERYLVNYAALLIQKQRSLPPQDRWRVNPALDRLEKDHPGITKKARQICRNIRDAESS